MYHKALYILLLISTAITTLASPCAPDLQDQSSSGLKNPIPNPPTIQKSYNKSSSNRKPPTPNKDNNNSRPPLTFSTANRPIYQATITGYGGACASKWGSCGFLANTKAYQGAVSAFWNLAPNPGRCGTCWRVTNGTNIDGGGKRKAPITTPPITVLVDNTCAPDPSKPGFQCNQDAQHRTDKFGSVTVLDLCSDTGAPQAFWGDLKEGTTGGLAVADIQEVDCEEWDGQFERVAPWTNFRVIKGGKAVGPR